MNVLLCGNYAKYPRNFVSTNACKISIQLYKVWHKLMVKIFIAFQSENSNFAFNNVSYRSLLLLNAVDVPSKMYFAFLLCNLVNNLSKPCELQ